MDNNIMKGLDRQEFITRIKALTEEQAAITAGLLTTDTLEQALRKRDELCTDIIEALRNELIKASDVPTIQEKEAIIKECGAIIRLFNARYNMED